MNITRDLAYQLLKYTYGIALIVVGLDKLLSPSLITDWSMYLGTTLVTITTMAPSFLIKAAGLAEALVGVLVLTKPKIGSLIAIVWLGLIILNLVNMGMFYDIAARDVLIAVGFLQLLVN